MDEHWTRMSELRMRGISRPLCHERSSEGNVAMSNTRNVPNIVINKLTSFGLPIHKGGNKLREPNFSYALSPAECSTVDMKVKNNQAQDITA